MRHTDTGKIAFAGILLLVLTFVEFVFFHNGSFIYLLLGSVFLYYGMQKREKWTVGTGLFFAVLALLSLWSFRIVVFLLLLYILRKLWIGTSAEELIRPLKEFKREPAGGIWKNKLVSVQTSPLSTYEWQDIHIQGLAGSIHVDVTDTVLPKGTSFISIRQGIGKIKLDIPYEIPVRIHCTTLLGDARIFGGFKQRLVNESLSVIDSYENKRPEDAELIITLAAWAGDIEVNRK